MDADSCRLHLLDEFLKAAKSLETMMLERGKIV